MQCARELEGRALLVSGCCAGAEFGPDLEEVAPAVGGADLVAGGEADGEEVERTHLDAVRGLNGSTERVAVDWWFESHADSSVVRV